MLSTARDLVRDTDGAPAKRHPSPTPRPLEQPRQALRPRHYSRRTEQTYASSVKRFIHLHNVRHPVEMAEPEINAFLTHLAVQAAVRQAGLAKRATCHTFWHSFATHLLEGDCDIRIIQELLGPSDVTPTMICTHVLNRGPAGVPSLVDGL